MTGPPSRRRAALGGLVALVLTVSLVAVGCGRRSSDESDGAPAVERTRPVLSAGPVQVAGVVPGTPLPPGVRDAALRTARSYVDAALTASLETGAAGTGYANLFVPALRDAATGKDAAALTDAGIAEPGSYRSEATPVALSAFAGADGVVVYVAPRFTVTTEVDTATGPLRIRREVELTVTRRGAEWPIVAYRVGVTRARPPAPATTTTAVAGVTP